MSGQQSMPYMNSRRRPPPTGDEEATAVVKLGELEDASALSIAETNVLLRVLEGRRKQHGKELTNKDIYLKAKDYTSMFARFQDQKTVEQVERETAAAREAFGLNHFERAQLASLCFDTAEEARTLVPSLDKMTDDDLQRLLDNISKLRDFS